MIQITGKYSTANVMCVGDTIGENVEDYAIAQIKMIADNEASKDSIIRVMPDVHPGKVGPIGLTMTVHERILPALVGVDIGCGMSMVRLGKIRKDYQKLDAVIRDNIPVGGNVRKKVHSSAMSFDYEALRCAEHIRKDKASISLGTLGGGNHFIELDMDEDGQSYLIVHSGSRHLGKEVYDYYMNAGRAHLKEAGIDDVPFELTYLEGALFTDYLHDLQATQEYAELNRQIIISDICKNMKWKYDSISGCRHNYVETSEEMTILRKGAISAKAGEEVIIPINMRDGVILGTGRGNPDWNCSAPHGSGRIASREAVLSSHTVSEFKASMKGIYSSCIGKDTLDEAPFAYRNVDYIREAVKDTVDITKVLKPVFNYKGGAGA